MHSMLDASILSAVLRISRTSMTQEALEAAIVHPVERYESAGEDGLAYAQVALPIQQDLWRELLRWLETVGPKLIELQKDGLAQGACIDIAVPFPDGQASRSVTVPSNVAALIGNLGVDIELTFYAVTNDK